MNCIIPGSNLRIFGKAIHALCRFGNEMYIEPTADKLSIRTVNLSKTAYAVVDFTPAFFTYYKVDEDEDDLETLKCKIPIKATLAIFKNTTQFEKNVSTCKIEYKSDDTKVMFRFKDKYDITKSHFIHLLDGEAIQAFYSKDISPNRISASSSLFSRALHNFQNKDSEISVNATCEKLNLRNYTEIESSAKMMRTQLFLNKSEFSMFNVTLETDIRFTLKQFRAAVAFADALNLDVILNFENCGKPLIIIVKNDVTFEANFVLSTLRFDGETQSTTRTSFSAVTPLKKLKRLVNNSRNGISQISSQPNILNEDNSDKKKLRLNDEDNFIPGSPENTQSKKTQLVFQRCFDLTFDPRKLPDFDVILVESSDPEDI